MGLLGPHSDPPLHHGEEDAHRDKGASRTGSRSKTALPIHRSAWKEYSPKFGRFLCAVRHAPYAPRAVSASLHACSQRLQASAHTRQCSMSISMACCSHSSAHKPHASAQARIAALAIAGSNAVCLETTLPVVAHTSEQLRHIVMQRFKCPTISSPRQASAQALHDWEQSKHASMHSISASASMAAVPGWVSSISLACVIWASPFLELVCSVTKAGKRSAHSPKCLADEFCEADSRFMHPSAWKGDSANFALCEFSEVASSASLLLLQKAPSTRFLGVGPELCFSHGDQENPPKLSHPARVRCLHVQNHRQRRRHDQHHPDPEGRDHRHQGGADQANGHKDDGTGADAARSILAQPQGAEGQLRDRQQGPEVGHV